MPTMDPCNDRTGLDHRKPLCPYREEGGCPRVGAMMWHDPHESAGASPTGTAFKGLDQCASLTGLFRMN